MCIEPNFAIVTPTYKPHFKYIAQYLKSFDQYVLDKRSTPIYFIIDNAEREQFERIAAPYAETCDLHILFFEDILLHYGITRSSEELLKTYGRYSFQTLKKFYAMMYIKKSKYLILDSESCWIRPVKMAELFDSFFRDPYIPYSSRGLCRDSESVKEQAVREVEYVLGVETDRWYIECFAWFYDYRILQDLVDRHGSPMELVKKGKDCADLISKTGKRCGVFEILMYCTFLEKNNDRYHYRFVDIFEEYKKYLPPEEFTLYQNARNFMEGSEGGFAERFCNFLTKSNIGPLTRLYSKNRFQIIRCQSEKKSDYLLQKQFLSAAGVVILAASQDHIFVPDARRKMVEIWFKQRGLAVKEFIKKSIKTLSLPLYNNLRTIKDRILNR